MHRHQLVYLKKDSPFEIIIDNDFQKANYAVFSEQVLNWINRGLPCVYPRQINNNINNNIQLGLTILWENQKHRVALEVDKRYIERDEELPLLENVFFNDLSDSTGVCRGDPCGRPPMDRHNTCTGDHKDRPYKHLFKFDNEDGLRPRQHVDISLKNIHIYGSFLFQYLTNQLFTQPTSDIDILLIYKYNLYALNAIQDIINTLENQLNYLIDGEIRFEKTNINTNNITTMDISIKELLSDSTTLLVKTNTDLYLLPRKELYENYPTLCV